MFFKNYTPKETVKSLVINAIVAAAYVVLTLLNPAFSYNMIQFRVAEMLVLLCFFRPDTIIGLTIGCLIANVGSPMPSDVIFGTLATFVSCVIMIYLPRLALATLMPVIINGLVVGAQLYFTVDIPFLVGAGWVALGELVVLSVGYLLFMVLMRNKRFMLVIGASRHLEVKW